MKSFKRFLSISVGLILCVPVCGCCRLWIYQMLSFTKWDSVSLYFSKRMHCLSAYFGVGDGVPTFYSIFLCTLWISHQNLCEFFHVWIKWNCHFLSTGILYQFEFNCTLTYFLFSMTLAPHWPQCYSKLYTNSCIAQLIQ